VYSVLVYEGISTLHKLTIVVEREKLASEVLNAEEGREDDDAASGHLVDGRVYVQKPDVAQYLALRYSVIC
jgi:hypothetical protein